MINQVQLESVPKVQSVTGIADLLDFRARSHGHKEAIVSGEERVSYNDLNNRAKSIARQLAAHGVIKGDKVALYLPNSIEYIASYFAIVGLGAIVVPVNPLLKPEEISHILLDSDARALIAHELLAASAKESIANTKTVEFAFVVAANGSGTVEALELGVPTKELEQRGSTTVNWPASIDPETTIAVIIYTSGTTGKPKGAMLSHHNLLSVFPARLDVMDVGENDRALCALPMCHIYGMSVIMIGTVAKAGTVVIMSRFEAAAALQLIEREHITLLPAVPAMYQMLLAQMNETEIDTGSVRVCFSGAAPLPVQAIRRIEDAFGAPVVEGYALTETACVATFNPLNGPRKAGSVGPAVPGATVGIAGDGGWLPPGPEHVGEILVYGPNIMLGYYKQPQATAEVLSNGWFRTGDLGYMDEDGYLYIVGRKKELILRGGANVYPREVEEVIMRLPGVVEVAVIGVPDENMGERVKAVVVSRNPQISEEVVKEHCAKVLADYKVPRIVEFVAMLPRNSTGKVLKRLLK